VHELREDLLEILVQVEAAIDFPEEEIELLHESELIRKIDSLRAKIGDIVTTYEWGRLLRDGARVCICGRPNVGKSSLLNALLGEQRVIVTPIPGTTRDVIEEAVNLDGLPVVLWDTAGIRMTQDQVEKLGVELSLAHLEKADAAIVVLDGSTALTDEDFTCLRATAGKKRLVVLNKHDLPLAVDLPTLTKAASGTELVHVSATSGMGLDALKKSVRKLLLNTEVEPSVVLSNLRHKAALIAGDQALSSAADSVRACHAAEFVAVNLQEAKERLEEIVGTVTSDDILELVFSKFCIGK
jgi:tRNA modification GTPase